MELSGPREWTSESQRDGAELGGEEGMKPVLWFIQHSALGRGPAAQTMGPLAWGQAWGNKC